MCPLPMAGDTKMTFDLDNDLDLGNQGIEVCGSSKYMCVPTIKSVCTLSEKLWPMLKIQNFINKMTFDKLTICAAPHDTCV